MSFDFITALKARADHARACAKRPCRECDRDRCRRCGGDMQLGGTSRDVDGSFEVLPMCEPCGAAYVAGKRIDAVAAMIPAKFGWARVGASELRERVGITRERFVDAHRAALAGRALVFVGAQGAGKTSVAVALFRAVLDAGRKRDASADDVKRAQRAAFVSAYDLARERARHKLGDGEAPLIDRATRASVTLIDDLGSEGDGQLSAVTDVLYERHAQDRPTWITTWMGPTEVGNRYGGGIARRVYEGALVIEVARAEWTADGVSEKRA